MIENMEGSSLENPSRDVTAEFMVGASSFNRFVDSLYEEPTLKVELDLTGFTNRMEFILLARRVKGFLEIKPLEQERKASIRCTKEQRAWEPNVFSSAVEWVDGEGG
jgi:hypothetical protein